tara:strand:+ start:68185 stop:68601 length:417 start_codon:yes stop_codon:yes gene_type:complete
MIKLDAPVQSTKRIDEKIIPMINIIFLLLMFFLIMGNISELVREDVIPPRSSSAGVSLGAPAEWILARDGTIVMGEQEMRLDQVFTWLAAPGNSLPKRVLLRVDGAALSGALLPLMDLMRDHGVEKIALVTINEDGNR